MRLTIDLEKPGKSEGHAFIPHSTNRSAYGSIAIPIGVVSAGKGPTVLITGGVHGDEFEAQVAIRKLYQHIDTSDVTGRIIFIPSLNNPACQAGARVSPIDDLNLNRVFPGSASGAVTEKIARFVHDRLAPVADIWLDYHSGGRSLIYEPMIAMHRCSDENRNQIAHELMVAFGGPLALIWDDFPEPSMAKGSADKHRCIYLGSEFGGGGTLSPRAHQLCLSGTLRLLEHAGLLRNIAHYEPSAEQLVLTVDGLAGHAFSPRQGLFLPQVALGESIEKGQRIGEIVPTDGLDPPSVPISAPLAGRVICLRHMANTEIGDVVMHVGVAGAA